VSEQPDRPPLLRVVAGGVPTDEEIAALVVVLSAASARAGEPAGAPRSRWNDRASLLRVPLRPGPGAWRATARS
jgi:hypothetical protein